MAGSRAALCVVLAVLAGAGMEASGAAKLRSGPPAGAKMATFSVLDVTGASAGRKVCYM